MNNQIKLLISGADMGGLIASCALRHDFHESSRHTDGFQIYRIEKDTLTVEDVDACDLSGIRYAVNATLHDNEASFVFDDKCKEQGITVIHVNPAKRNVLDLKNETCKNREKRNVLKISHTRHFKTTKMQSKTGCFYSF